MDGKDVDRAVREFMRPALRDAGFDAFAGRRAWRRHDQTVDHIVVRSFNANIAHGVGCTTYSFAVEGGVFYPSLSEADLDRPKEYDCTFRIAVCKSLRQPFFHPYGSAGPDRPDVWYVLADGTNLEQCAHDATQAVTTRGLAVLDRLGEPQHAYQALLTERSTVPAFDGVQLTMPGNPGSPHWTDTTLALGHLIGADATTDMRSAPVVNA